MKHVSKLKQCQTPLQGPMRIAIPLIGTRVAPRLCLARDVLVLETTDGELRAQRQIHVGRLSDPWAFLEWLAQQAIDLVLCCGVTRQACATLSARGVHVVWGLTGEAEQIAADFLAGRLSASEPSAQDRTRKKN